MPPTRADTKCWLLGQVDNGLDEKWIAVFNQVEESKDLPLAFGDKKPKLPTKGQVLNLLMFGKKSAKMKTSSTGNVAEWVLKEVYRYWKMANIGVMTHFFAKKKLIQIFTDYQKQREGN